MNVPFRLLQSQPKRSPSQLELTLNPSINQTAAFAEACRGDGLLPVDSGSVSHAGSFPEVALSHTHRSRRPEESAGGGDRASAGRQVSHLSPGDDPADGSKVRKRGLVPTLQELNAPRNPWRCGGGAVLLARGITIRFYPAASNLEKPALGSSYPCQRLVGLKTEEWETADVLL